MNLKSLIPFIVFFAIIIAFHITWAKRRINQWAKSNGYKILKCKICLTNIGPFSYFGTSGGQSIFKIEAVNAEGTIKKGYARAGGYFFGLLRKRVEVKWDKIPLGQ